MQAVLTNQTIDILSGQKSIDFTSKEIPCFGTSNIEMQPDGFKGKIKKAWAGILNVAEDIKEKILPIIDTVCRSIASLITSVAYYRNSQPRYATGRVA